MYVCMYVCMYIRMFYIMPGYSAYLLVTAIRVATVFE